MRSVDETECFIVEKELGCDACETLARVSIATWRSESDYVEVPWTTGLGGEVK